MSLRARLVGALGVLLALGLAVFGLTTYGFYSRSQYSRLDDQLRSSVPLVTRALMDQAGLGGDSSSPSGSSSRPGRPAPPPVVAPSTYAELHNGTTVTQLPFNKSDPQTAVPDIPASLPSNGHFFTVDSKTGSGRWRVYVDRAFGLSDGSVAVAIPTTEVDYSLHRLLLIESLSAVALLAVLGTGSWLVLRRGLRPLERMATSARSISAGDLSQRVTPADSKSEVGQLGEALNTMLGEIEAAFKEREANEQRLRQFLADASHELRTPLTSIRGYAELARMRAQPTDAPDDSMRRIEVEGTRMSRLVEDLLVLARGDQGAVARRELVEVDQLLAETASAVRAAHPDRQLLIARPTGLVVSGDRDQLLRVLLNLATNAAVHTPPNGPIRLDAVPGRTPTGPAVALQVIDTGPGLTPDEAEHVFERFWRADKAR
ncbi:MAG: histidine kinase, partial [Acidimicrobiia bacterium]|nr:histidine kinase [Acidimicrobiia bacterium]